MGFVESIKCPRCRWETSATTGNWENVLNVCTACRRVVNPKRVPFRLDPVPCPHCGGPVPPYTESPECCPACGSRLIYKEILHFSLRGAGEDRYPPIGALVHAVRGHPTERHRWDVTGTWLGAGEVVLFGVPDALADWRYEGQPVLEAEVVGIEMGDEGRVGRLYLEFRRLAWYGPHPPA
jgi:DNA-directed RNA polymerase subunit RPC12/RpoP